MRSLQPEELTKERLGRHELLKAHKPDNVALSNDLKTIPYTDFVSESGFVERRTLRSTDPAKTIVEQREVVPNPNSYPWNTIGKLFVGQNDNFASPIWTGTACLMGDNMLLTASHNAPWNRPGPWMRFVPAYSNAEEPFGSSYVAEVHGFQYVPGQVGRHDYVICRLYTPLGATLGSMGAEWWSSDLPYQQRLWSSVGYPTDSANGQVQMVETDLPVWEVDPVSTDGKDLITRDYWSDGWGGGPLWTFDGGQPLIAAVMSGWRDISGNLSAVNSGGQAMVDLISYGFTTWPTS